MSTELHRQLESSPNTMRRSIRLSKNSLRSVLVDSALPRLALSRSRRFYLPIFAQKVNPDFGITRENDGHLSNSAITFKMSSRSSQQKVAISHILSEQVFTITKFLNKYYNPGVCGNEKDEIIDPHTFDAKSTVNDMQDDCQEGRGNYLVTKYSRFSDSEIVQRSKSLSNENLS